MRIFKSLAASNRNIIIAIESSCDDACLAIMNSRNKIIHEYKCSQKVLHQPFGGIVPQLAAQAHRNFFQKIMSEDLIQKYFKLNRVKCVAVTSGPGIGSCLNVGFEFASQLSRSNDVPLVKMNHLVTKFYFIAFYFFSWAIYLVLIKMLKSFSRGFL